MNLRLKLTKDRRRHGCGTLDPDEKSAIECSLAKPKSDFYEQLLKGCDKAESENKEQLQELYASRMKLLYTCLGTQRRFRVKSESNLKIGGGTSSVLDTYLSLHHIYSVPFIPGSALKGITARYCDQVAGTLMEEFRVGGRLYEELFGTTENKGWIVFHDAFPVDPSPRKWLQLDVMTPHHQKYNSYSPDSGRGQGFAPRDDDSPEPVPFLAVRATFDILLSCEGLGPDVEDRLDLAEKLVQNALEQDGIGAKRNAGYGLLKVIGGQND